MYVINVAGKNLNYQWELYVPENVDVDKYIKDWLKAEYGIDDTYYITYGKNGLGFLTLFSLERNWEWLNIILDLHCLVR